MISLGYYWKDWWRRKHWEENIDEDVEHTLEARFSKTKSYPEHAVHMFAENKPAKKHNETQLNNMYSQLVCIEAIDEFPKNINV